jgi:hypothetical protein
VSRVSVLRAASLYFFGEGAPAKGDL